MYGSCMINIIGKGNNWNLISSQNMKSEVFPFILQLKWNTGTCLLHFFFNLSWESKINFRLTKSTFFSVSYDKIDTCSLPVSPDISRIYCLLFFFFSLNGEQAVKKIIHYRKKGLINFSLLRIISFSQISHTI